MRLLAFGLGLFLLPLSALSADKPEYTTVLQNHVFKPSQIAVKTDTPFILHVQNLDTTAEEFDSSDLAIEKLVAPGNTATIHVPALKSGSYAFVGEYHADTAHGTLIAR